MTTCRRISLQCLPETLQKSIERIVISESYSSYNINVRSVTTEGISFLGQVLEIDINGETINGFKELNIFLKLKREVEDIILVSPSNLFQRESYFYSELADIFNYLQDNAQVPPQDRFKAPKSYTATTPDAIFLENLSTKGFKTYNRMDTLPLKCIELAFMEIARFHGLSFVIENKMPKYFENNIKVIEDPLRFDENYFSFIRNVFDYVSDICDDATKIKLEKFIPEFFEKFTFYRRDKTSTTCALSHGDFKSSNILVRQHDGEPTEVRIVDYQFIDYGCPLRDLFLILTANADQNIRKNHLDDLKELYYKTLSSYLKYFNLDVENVYPRSEFDRVFSEWFNYGLMMTISFLPFIFAPAIGIDFTTVNLSEVPLDLDQFTKEKVKKLLQDFTDYM